MTTKRRKGKGTAKKRKHRKPSPKSNSNKANSNKASLGMNLNKSSPRTNVNKSSPRSNPNKTKRWQKTLIANANDNFKSQQRMNRTGMNKTKPTSSTKLSKSQSAVSARAPGIGKVAKSNATAPASAQSGAMGETKTEPAQNHSKEDLDKWISEEVDYWVRSSGRIGGRYGDIVQMLATLHAIFPFFKPEDQFSIPLPPGKNTPPLKDVKKKYRMCAKFIHPDKNGIYSLERRVKSRVLFSAFNDAWDRYQATYV